MEFHKPKRLLGLFGKRHSSTTRRPSQGEDDYSQPDISIKQSASSTSADDLNIIRLTSQRDVLIEELRLTKANLEKEKKTTHDLNQRLIMKAISIDCQLAETEERFAQSRAKIDAANTKNKEMSDSLLAVRMENQNLMKRTAALARRDQIQKATIMASNAEIIKLMTTVEAFQERFLSLHDAVKSHKEKHNEEMPEIEESSNAAGDNDKATKDESSQIVPLDTSSSEDSLTPFEEDQMSLSDKQDRNSLSYAARVKEFQAKLDDFNAKRQVLEAKQRDHSSKEQAWHVERDDLFACIKKLKSNNKEIKKKFVQTLKKHQWKWHKEKEKLLKKVGDLEVWLEEKDAELVLAKNALKDAYASREYNLEKGNGGIEKTDTFSTLDTQDEDSLSTCSSTSLSIAYSLTDNTNNLSKNGDEMTTLSSVFEPLVIQPSGSFSSTQCLETPPRSNSSTASNSYSTNTADDDQESS